MPYYVFILFGLGALSFIIFGIVASRDKKKKAEKERIEKEELINSIEPFKESIKDYNGLLVQLRQLNLEDLRSNIDGIKNKIKRANNLIDKYGEETAVKLLEHNYFLGMTEEQLIDCKGKPTKIETEVLKTKTKVVYIYGNKSSGDVFTFVNGELERFKDR